MAPVQGRVPAATNIRNEANFLQPL